MDVPRSWEFRHKEATIRVWLRSFAFAAVSSDSPAALRTAVRASSIIWKGAGPDGMANGVGSIGGNGIEVGREWRTLGGMEVDGEQLKLKSGWEGRAGIASQDL